MPMEVLVPHFYKTPRIFLRILHNLETLYSLRRRMECSREEGGDVDRCKHIVS